jgi:hypothetical protein
LHSYVLKGEDFSTNKCIGVAVVLGGALYYNAVKETNVVVHESSSRAVKQKVN